MKDNLDFSSDYVLATSSELLIDPLTKQHAGLDEGDMRAVDHTFKQTDAPCQLDKEDKRFVLKGSCFSPMQVTAKTSKLWWPGSEECISNCALIAQNR